MASLLRWRGAAAAAAAGRRGHLENCTWNERLRWRHAAFGAAGVAGFLGLSKTSDCDSLDAILLPPEKLNQSPGRPQSMNAWTIVKEGEDHYVERSENRNERYKSPDGGNFADGVAHPPFIRQQNWSKLRQDYVGCSKPTDIWVTTFPKCGTTFMEQIILLLLNDGDASKLDPKVHNAYSHETGVGKVWVEAKVRVVHGDKGMRGTQFTLQEFQDLPTTRRVLKTHAPRQMFLGVSPVLPASYSASGRPSPLAPGIKVVYVSRNAKDACVSSYYHADNPHKIGFPFDAWVVNWMSGLFEHGRWSDHVAGWRNEYLNNPDQVLWVRYEDLQADAEKEIRRVAAFLEIPVTDEVIAKTVHGSGFAQMQSQSGGSGFFRKGVVGDYRRHFSSQLNQEFDLLYKEQMRGVSDPYADFE